MEGYKWMNVWKCTWLKKITKNKALKVATSGKRVLVFDKYDNSIGDVKAVNKSRFEEKLVDMKKEAKSKSGSVVLTFWIPVKWYDRFSGEEVEAFDTVRGLEEYNREFEEI